MDALKDWGRFAGINSPILAGSRAGRRLERCGLWPPVVSNHAARLEKKSLAGLLAFRVSLLFLLFLLFLVILSSLSTSAWTFQWHTEQSRTAHRKESTKEKGATRTMTIVTKIRNTISFLL